MKHRHTKGLRKITKHGTDWYKQLEEANIRQVEAEWQAKQQGQQ